MSLSALESTVNTAFDARDAISTATKGEVRDAVDHALELLDRGEVRVAEREANLAIVVVRGRHCRGGRRRQNGDAEGGVLAKRNCMMMPAEQDSLDQDRERARQRSNPAPYLSSPTDQDHRRAAPRISILPAPAPAAELGGRLIYYNGLGKS